MATISRLLAATVFLAAAAAAAAAAQPLEPEWSRPVGGRVKFVGVEEYGRCSVFVDSGVVQIVTPSGAVSWTWPFARISKYLNPRDVAVSPQCDAIALVGDASYKFAWIVDRDGTSASIKFVATPAGVVFDRKGALVAVGTYGGTMSLYSRNGTLQWKRDTGASTVNNLEFTDDNQRILFKGWAGVGVVTVAGQVEWSTDATQLAASRDLRTLVLTTEPGHGPGPPSYIVADERRRTLWGGEWGAGAFVSANGDRVLLDLPGGARLVTRDRTVINEYPNYSPVAFSEDGALAWMWREDSVDCLNDRGDVLATIKVAARRGDVKVSRDFAQVVVARQANGKPVSVDRYDVPPACRQ